MVTSTKINAQIDPTKPFPDPPNTHILKPTHVLNPNSIYPPKSSDCDILAANPIFEKDFPDKLSEAFTQIIPPQNHCCSSKNTLQKEAFNAYSFSTSKSPLINCKDLKSKAKPNSEFTILGPLLKSPTSNQWANLLPPKTNICYNLVNEKQIPKSLKRSLEANYHTAPKKPKSLMTDMKSLSLVHTEYPNSSPWNPSSDTIHEPCISNHAIVNSSVSDPDLSHRKILTIKRSTNGCTTIHRTTKSSVRITEIHEDQSPEDCCPSVSSLSPLNIEAPNEGTEE